MSRLRGDINPISHALRLTDYLEHIHQATIDALNFVDGMTIEEFVEDRRSQQAVIMSFLIIGEASARVMDAYPDFAQSNAAIPWRSMRNMRNRMAHGYFDINLQIVWDTVGNWLPGMLEELTAAKTRLDLQTSEKSSNEPRSLSTELKSS
jgi:uncharacterized protein with HEPN domain